MSAIWDSWWNWLGSKGLGSPPPPALLLAAHVPCLLGQLHVAFLRRCHMALAFSVYWGLLCNVSFTLVAPHNGLPGSLWRDSCPTLSDFSFSLKPWQKTPLTPQTLIVHAWNPVLYRWCYQDLLPVGYVAWPPWTTALSSSVCWPGRNTSLRNCHWGLKNPFSLGFSHSNESGSLQVGSSGHLSYCPSTSKEVSLQWCWSLFNFNCAQHQQECSPFLKFTLSNKIGLSSLNSTSLKFLGYTQNEIILLVRRS